MIGGTFAAARPRQATAATSRLLVEQHSAAQRAPLSFRRPVRSTPRGEFILLLDQATTTEERTEGDWVHISTVNGAVIPGTCVKTGKNKGFGREVLL
jgi:hypothetical protein